MSESSAYVGIDVSKSELEVAVGGEAWTVANDASGIETLLATLSQRAPTLVVLEATGGHETAAVAALAESGLPVVVANPRQVRWTGHGSARQDGPHRCEGARAFRRARAARGAGPAG